MDATTVETQSSQLVLNGSQSTSTNSGALTYSWIPSPGYPSAAIIGVDTATPLVQFVRKGTYQFMLTVTDRTGASATYTLTVRYV